MKKLKNPQKETNKKEQKTNKEKKKLSTAAQELVTFDCSLTLQPCVAVWQHSALLLVIGDWLALYVKLSLLKDLTKIGKTPCNAFLMKTRVSQRCKFLKIE